MDTISYNSPTSTYTPETSDSSDDLGILQPQQSPGLRTVSNIIVYTPKSIQTNNHVQRHETILQNINARAHANTNGSMQSSFCNLQQTNQQPTVSTTKNFGLPSEMTKELQAFNFHEECMKFYRETDYFRTCVGTYTTPVANTSLPDVIFTVAGRIVSDPFPSHYREESISEISELLRDLPVPVKMDQSQININFELPTIQQYYNERYQHLSKMCKKYQTRINSYGTNYAIDTSHGIIEVVPSILMKNEVAEVINRLVDSFDNNNIKCPNQINQHLSNNLSMVTNNINNVNIVSGENGSIKINATNPLDPGPQSSYEPPVEPVSDGISFTPGTTWQDYELDCTYDYQSSTPYRTPYHTPSYHAYYSTSEEKKDVSIHSTVDDTNNVMTVNTNTDMETDEIDRNTPGNNEQPALLHHTDRRTRILLETNNAMSAIITQNSDIFANTTSNNNNPTIILPKPQGTNRPALYTDPMEIPVVEVNEADYINFNHVLHENIDSSSDDDDDIEPPSSTDTYSADVNAIIDHFDELLYGDRSDDDTPQPFDDGNQQQQQIDEQIDEDDANEEILQIKNEKAFQQVTFVDTNLLFDKLEIGKGKQYISGASGYPPTFNVKINNFVACRASYTCDNMKVYDSSISTSLFESKTTQLCTFQQVPQVLQSKTTKVNINHALFTDHIKAYQNIEKSRIQVIEPNRIVWYINVPVLMDDGQTRMIQMMADTGANHPCVNYAWAFKHFKNYIDHVSKHDATINTASHQVKPKYSLHFIFPTKSGILLKTKFYLINDLPCNILADINMLLAFGYTFKMEDKPQVFRHEEEPDANLHIKTFEDQHKVHEPVTSSITSMKQTLDSVENLVESIVIEDSEPVKNKSNENTEPSILCTTLDEYKAYKCNMDRYTGHTVVNYINHDLSIAQNVFIPSEHDLVDEKQVYLHGINPNPTANECRMYRKYKLGDNLQPPQINVLDSIDSKEKHQFTSTVPINESYKEQSESNVSTKQLLVATEFQKSESNANYIYNKQSTTDKSESVAENNNQTDGKQYKFEEVYNGICNNTSNNTPAFNLTLLQKQESKKYYGTSVFSRLTNKILQTSHGSIMNIHNKNPNNTYHNINFIMMRESFKATKAEKLAANELKSKKDLKHISFDYLKTTEKLDPRLKGLHQMTVDLVDEFKDIFATHTYDRRTMKVPHARLGIIDKFRHITCFRAQYPLSVQKRLWMIEYTNENDDNGYWVPVERTLHCIPYLMIPKRNKNGEVIRYRPAFDARVVNQYLHLYPIHLPTMKDFDEIYSIKGLFTLMDMKNMFDCIPLHKDDRPWSTVMTPLGIRQMHHLAYGFKNCPYFAQNIMNRLAMHTGLTLVYIDDIVMKHHWHWTAKQHIDHLRKIFMYIREKNMLLNPSKFFPFVTKCTSFGIERTFHGSSISDAYKQKIVRLKRPTTKRELREFQGTLNYISRYLYKGSMIQYWLNQLMIETPEKRGTLNWNKPAELAFQQLKWLAANAPLLHNPTLDGKFMVKTDACMTGIGAVLYQEQFNKKTNKNEWVIIDMFNKMMPKDYRRAHSVVHEAYGVAATFEYWKVYLMKREFISYTDNRGVSRVFRADYEGLDQLTQDKLIRLRVSLAPFTFIIKHVPAVDNVIADGLSRETIRIINKVWKNDITSIEDIDPNNDVWLSFGEAIKSIDTRYKKKTAEQIKEIEKDAETINKQALKISKHIVNINQQLMNHDYNQYINELNKNENIINSNRPSNEKPVRVPNKRQIIDESINLVYKNCIETWQNKLPTDAKEQFNEYVNLQSNIILTKDEYSNDEPMRSTMTENYVNCVKLCNKLTNATLSNVAKVQEHVYDDIHYKTNVLFQNTRGKKLGCVHDMIKCLYCQKIPSYEKSTENQPTTKINTKTNQSVPTHTTQTLINHQINAIKHSNKRKTRRNKKKEKQTNNIEPTTFENDQQKEIKRILRSDTRKQPYSNARRTSYLNEDFDDLTDRRLIRQEFLYNLFGHRTDKHLFDRRTFIERQVADTELSLIKSIIARIDDKNSEIDRNNIESFKSYTNDNLTAQQQLTNSILEDYDSLLESNPIMATHITDNSLKIEQNALYYHQTIDGIKYKSLVVPGILKLKILDYAHHNIHSHHNNWEQSYNNIKREYWWCTMKRDMRRFVERCLLCQFANGSIKNRAPLTTREPVLPRESVFGDFLELQLAGKRHYILVLVDYCTGWTMLLPTHTNDAYTVVDALIRKWIPLHGQFKYFDSDQGSGFIGNVTKLLISAFNADLQYAEPGYHRGIGKVERTIRIIQDNFQRINIQWDEVITDCKDADRVFNILRVITPHIQAAINQRRPRISTFSPNMLMFGTQLKDISNIDILIERMKEIFCNKNEKQLKEALKKYKKSQQNNKQKQNNNANQKDWFDTSKYKTNPFVATTVTTNKNNNQESNNDDKLHSKQSKQSRHWRKWNKSFKTRRIITKKKAKYKYDDYAYLEKLLQVFRQIYEIYKSDWHKYTYQSKKSYENKYNINDATIERNNKIFTTNARVLYFVGNKQLPNRKWLRRFTGPWTVVLVLSDGTVIIEDPSSKIQKRVSINRLKLFKQSDMNNYSHISRDDEYDEYNKQLKDILFKVSENDELANNRGTDLNYKQTRAVNNDNNHIDESVTTNNKNNNNNEIRNINSISSISKNSNKNKNKFIIKPKNKIKYKRYTKNKKNKNKIKQK